MCEKCFVQTKNYSNRRQTEESSISAMVEEGRLS